MRAAGSSPPPPLLWLRSAIGVFLCKVYGGGAQLVEAEGRFLSPPWSPEPGEQAGDQRSPAEDPGDSGQFEPVLRGTTAAGK